MHKTRRGQVQRHKLGYGLIVLAYLLPEEIRYAGVVTAYLLLLLWSFAEEVELDMETLHERTRSFGESQDPPTVEDICEEQSSK
jgi:hypothetical protein